MKGESGTCIAYMCDEQCQRIICVMKLSMKSLYAYKDYSAIEVLARLSKNGAVGQNILYSFSSSALNFHGQTSDLDMVHP